MKKILFWIMVVWLILALYATAIWAIGLYTVMQLMKGR